MAYQPVDIGAAPNDGTGDPIRDAFDKVNDNFVEVYALATGLLDFKGSTDCSANPNYPAASKGDFYVVSVAGKIGGASGIVVEVGDAYFAEADNAGGTQAAVGTSWSVIQANIVGATITELDDIPDVNAPTPADGDFLKWDSTPGEWVPGTPAGGVTDLDDLSDVDLTGQTTGDVLTYDGADWVPQAPSSTAALSAMYEDQKTAGTAGGTATAGAWGGRILNTEAYDDIGLALRSSAFTVTIASPGVFTWTSHGLVAGSVLTFTTTGALPTGLAVATPYYVIAAGLTANDFQVSATLGGAAVNTSGTQSGVHTAASSTISLSAGIYETETVATFFATNSARVRLRDITNGITLALSTSDYGSFTGANHVAPTFDGRFTLAGTAIVQLEYRVETTRATDGLGVSENFGEVEIYVRLKLTKLS